MLKDKLEKIRDPDTQNTGKEGLTDPSELGVIPTGEFLSVVPFGGGCYFIPPIPKQSITNIGQQFLKCTYRE